MIKLSLNKNYSHHDAAVAPLAKVISVAMETRADVALREKLLDAAMGLGRKRKSSEKIRRGRMPAEGLAFAAHDAQGHLVGTVRLWNVSAGQRNGENVPALLLGPLAVHPAYEGYGIGSKLMREAIRLARMQGHGAILLVGDPDYYQRFGFSADKTHSLAMPGPYEKHRFQALELDAGYLDGACGVLKPTGKKKAES